MEVLRSSLIVLGLSAAVICTLAGLLMLLGIFPFSKAIPAKHFLNHQVGKGFLDDKTQERNNPFLYRLHTIMFGIQFVGLWLVILSFMYLFIFGGALDIMGDFADYRPTARILPFTFLFTQISYKLYPKFTNRKPVMLGLLIPTIILNAALALYSIILLYQFVPWLLILV